MRYASQIAVAGAFLLLPIILHAQSETMRCSIKVEPSTVASGENVRLTWSSIGATSAALDGFGSVQTAGTRSVAVHESRSFKLTITGQQGGKSSCEASVHVVAARPSCFITAWPGTIHEGSSATISWGSSNATSIFISNIGAVSREGTLTVRPNMTTTYAISATGQNGSCAESARVIVEPSQSQYGYIPQVAKSLFAPLFVNTFPASRQTNTQGDTWYFEDEYYSDDWFSSEYEDYWDGSYEDSADDEYYSSYDESYGDYYDENYSNTDDYDYGSDDTNDCWWDWWCGDGGGVQETQEEWDEPYYQNYSETYYSDDPAYNNEPVETYENWQ